MNPSDFSAEKFISQSLQKRQEQNALRKLIVNENAIDFCSNDYLGFARSSDLRSAIEKEYAQIQNSGNGSTGSRLLAGNTAYAETLEKKIAAFHDTAAALIYNSGYDANLGLFSALGQKECTIIYDELIHASVHDGIKMSAAAAFMFKHNDLFHLEERLKISEGTVFVAVESVYSMDGDEALLIEIATLCKRYNANLIVDEAHATGVTSNAGKGLVQKLNLQAEVFARVHTFGKAMGCHGAAVVGSNSLRDYLINFSRAFIYTTALPVHSLVAINQSYLLLERSENEILKLADLIKAFKSEFAKIENAELVPSNSPIQCVVIPGNGNVKKVAESLQKEGLDVRPILSPTVQKGKERLRICLHSYNNHEQINRLINLISRQLPTIDS